MIRVLRLRKTPRIRHSSQQCTDARTILREAEEDAAGIIAYAQKKAEKMQREARQHGQNQARAEAAAMLLNLQEYQHKTRQSVENETIDLALHVAEKLSFGLASQSSEFSRRLARELIQQRRPSEVAILEVHPEELPILSKELQIPNLEVRGSSKLSRGECVLITTERMIDGRLETRTAQLRKALLEAKRKCS